MKIFTSNEIKTIEQLTIEAQSVSSIELMERAASAIACELISRWTPSRKFIVFAGSGNNGGDALAVARLLIEQGYKVETFLFNIGGNNLSPQCLINRDKLLELRHTDFFEFTQGEFSPPFIADDDIVIDGLFGGGLNRPLTGGFQSMVRYINENASTIVSIDIPSGLFSEWNAENDRNNIIKATLTLSIGFPRLSFFFNENARFVGEVLILDIDYDERAIAQTHSNMFLVEQANIQKALKPREPNCNKFDFGTLYLVAGSYGMMGAAVIAAKSALRTGCGTVTVHAPRCGMSVLQASVPEAMYVADKHEIIPTDITPRRSYRAIAIGPGLGTHKSTIDALEQFLNKHSESPCVFDADALNCICERPSLLELLPVKSIITPHAGEFDRLFGKHFSDETRLRKAIEMAHFYNIIIVLKGRHSIIVRPDGRITVNISGNPGMATPGSGDALTGIIASLLAQGYKPEVSAVAGAYIHAVAGNIACGKKGSFGMLASDIVDAIPSALQKIIL